MGLLREMFAWIAGARGRSEESPRRVRIREGEIRNHHLARQWFEDLEGRQYLSDPAIFGFTFHSGDSTTDTNLNALFSSGTGASTNPVSFDGSIQANGQSLSGNFEVKALDNTETNYQIWSQDSSVATTMPNSLASLSSGSISSGSPLSMHASSISGSLSGGSISVSKFSSTSLTPTTISWASSGDPQIATTGSLTISSGQSLTAGSFTISGSGSNVSISVGSSSINLSSGAITATITSGTLTVSTSGISGSGSGSAETFTSSGVQFSGNFGFSVDTTSSDPNLQVTASPATLTIGQNVFSANVKLELQSSAGNSYVALEMSSVTMDIKDGGTTYLHFVSTATTGFFFQNGGVVGAIEGNVTVTAPGTGGASDAGGEALIQINTMPLTTSNGSQSTSNDFEFPDPYSSANPPANIDIAADSGLQVFVRDLTVHMSSGQTISGDFYFSAATVSGHTVVEFSASNIGATIGNAVLANGSGNLRIDSGGVSTEDSNGNVVPIDGDVSFASGGVSASGNFGVSVADGTVTVVGVGVTINVDNEQFTGSFSVTGDSTQTTFAITDTTTLEFDGGLVQVGIDTGSNFTITSAGDASGSVTGELQGSVGGATFAGNIGITFNTSPASISLSGTGDSVAIGDQDISGDFGMVDNGASGVAITGSNIFASLGGGLVTVGPGASFSLTVTTGDVSGGFSGTVSAAVGSEVSFGGTVAVTFDTLSGVSASGTLDTFTVGGQQFTASFGFSEDAVGLELMVSDINFTIGSLTVDNASGNLVVGTDTATSKTSVSGSFGATFPAGVNSFSGDVEVDFTTDGTFTFNATNVTFNDGHGDSVSGNMTITYDSVNNVLDLQATNLSASLDGGLVTISPPASGGASDLQISGGVFSGTFDGVVSAGTATGVLFSGPITVTVGASGISASGTGDTLTIGGQNISADFSFTTLTGPPASLQLHVDNVSFAVGALLAVNGASGDLTVDSTGVSGSASGTVTESLAGFTGTLGVGFAPGSIDISGTNDTITIGADESISGSFNFKQDASGLHLSATDFKASFANGLVTVDNGSATLDVNNTTGAISGGFSGDLGVGVGSPFSLSGSISVSVAAGAITASGTNDTATIFSQPFTGSFAFSEDANGLELSVMGLSFSMGGVLSIASASGTLHVTSSGITGSTSGNITSTLVGLSGTFGVGFGAGGLLVSGTNDKLSIGDQSIGGDFAFSVDGPDLDLNITNASANLGGGLVDVTGSAELMVSGGDISGNFNGNLAIGTATTASFSGPVSVAVDSSAGTITAGGTGDTVTIAGQSLTGNFSFAENSTTHVLELTVGNVNLAIGTLLSVTITTGQVDITPAGVSGTVTGSLNSSSLGLTANSFGITFAPGSIGINASGAALNIAGQSLGGDFDFIKNISGIHLSSSDMTADFGGGLVTVSNGSANLTVSTAGQITGTFTATVEAGTNMTAGGVGFGGTVTVTVAPSGITASGVGDLLTIAGNQLVTNFTFSKNASGVNLGVSNLNLSIGNNAISITNASGTLLVTSSGVSGSASGTLSTNLSAGLKITGTLAVTFGGGTISISGTNDTLTAGGQTISGDFNFTKDSSGVHLAASNFNVSLGGGLVSITNGSGALDIVNGNISGSFSGSLAAGTVGGSVSFTGSIQVSVGNGTISAATLPGQDDTLTIGTQPITAAFSFVKNASGLQLTLSDLSFSVGGVVSLTDGGGTLNVASNGVSGSVMGTIATSFTGFSFSGTLAATFAPGSLQISGTNDKLTAGGQSISGNFIFIDDSTGVHLTANNFGASFGNGIVTITGGSGSLDIISGAISGSFVGTVAAGSGDSGFSFSGPISVTFGNGSFEASTPSGQTDSLTVLGQTLSAGFDFSENSSGVQLTLSDVNLSFAGGAIQVTDAGGTVSVTKTAITGAISGGLSASIPGVTFISTNFNIAFSPTSLSISGTGVSLSAYGQTISGNFTFNQTSGAVSLQIDNLSLSIANIINVTEGSGSFTLVSGAGGGMSGTASGNVSITGLGNSIQFGGSYSVTIGNGSTSVSGTGDTLTIFGQKLVGNFTFTKTADSVDLHINSLNLSLGGGVVRVTGGAADFTVDSTGVTGTATGTISVGSTETGFGISGIVTVNVSPTSLTVEDDNAQITVAGATLSADELLFSRDKATGNLGVTITNLGLSLSGAPSPISFSGSLLVMPAGLSGEITGSGDLDGVTGTITVSFGNGTYQVAVGISSSFSETLGPVSISGMVNVSLSTGAGGTLALTNLTIDMGNGLLTITGGSAQFGYDGTNISGTATGTVMLNGVSGVSLSGTVGITITPSTIQVTGTGMNLTVLGQTLAGDFAFTDNGDGTIDVGVSNLSISLANSISVTNGIANFTIGSGGAEAGVKGSGSAQLDIDLPGVNFSSAFSLSIDTTGGNSTFLITADPITLSFAGLNLTGSFTVQKTTTSKGVSTVSLVASGVNVFIGDGDTGVQVSDAGGAIMILSTGLALDVAGSAALVGIPNGDLTLAGTLHVLYNDTGSDVNETLPAPDPANPGQTTTTTLSVPDGTNVVEGTATLGISSGGITFVSMSGGFSISQSVTTDDTTHTQQTQVILAAAGMNAFIGNGATTNADGTLNTANAQGVLIQNADLGLILLSSIDESNPNNPVHSPATFALDASGTASLPGIPGLSISGTLSVQYDTAGPQDVTVQVPDPINPGSTIPVAIDFTGDQLPSFAGSITLAVANPSDLSQQFVSFTGDFSFTQPDSNTISVAVTDVSAFVGIGGTNPIGLQITGGSLGLLLIKQGGSTNYALAANGNISLVGLPGLYVGGSMSVLSNTTGSPQTNPANSAQTIPNGGPTIGVTGMSFQILDSSGNPVIAITASATITKTGSVIDINATQVGFAINVNDSQVVDLEGSVEFTIGSDGFKLGANGFSLTGFSLLGQTILGPPGGQSHFATIAPGPVSNPTTTPGSTGAPGSVTSITTPSGTPYKLGPLSLYGLSPIFKDFSFSGGQLEVTVGLSAAAAMLSFGGSNPGGTQAELTNFAGSFQLAVGLDLSSFRITSFGPTGKFSFTADTFVLDVPHVVNVVAQNIAINYDPSADDTQQLISIGTATVTVPLGSGGNGIQGQIAPFTDSSGNTIPGLVVYGDHFVLGTATLRYLGTLSLGGFVSFTNPFISVSDLSVSFNGSLDFNGSISIGADSVKLGPSSFQVTGTGVTATLTNNNGDWGFTFTAASIGLTIASVIQMSATNVTFNPTATGADTLLSLSTLQVVVSLKALTLTGSAGAANGSNGVISIDGAGDVSLPNDFQISVSISAGSSGDMGWPSWVPIQVSNISLQWTDFNDHPDQFLITFTASINATIGPIQIQGEVDNVQIDVGKLLAGQFPIVGMTSGAISATGNVFGGTLNAGVVMGIIKLDQFDHQLPATAATYDHTIFYFGIEGGFTMPGLGGLDIRFGMSQNGPLEAYIQLDPGPGILIVPPAGLAIVGLSGGITFDATPFPTISTATDLKNPVFTPGVVLSLSQWENQLRQETVNQAGGGGGGYLFSISTGNASGFGTDPTGDAATLNSATPSVAADMVTAFEDNGDVLSGNEKIKKEGTGEWLIQDGANYYLVTQNGVNLDVSQYRFAIDANSTGAKATVPSISSIVADLNSGTVTTNIISAFSAYGISLPSTGATVQAVAPAPGQTTSSWIITVGSFKYQVTQDAAGVLLVESSGGSMNALGGVIRIEASVSLGLEGVPANEFSATGDIIIETDGKILMNVNATFGQGAASFNFRLYMDLSKVTNGQVTIMFYFEQDVQIPGTTDPSLTFPQLVIAGGVQMGETDSSGNFVNAGDPSATGFGFKLNGEIVYSPVPIASLTFNGSAAINFTSTEMTLIFEATLSANIANFIQANNVVTAAGSFTVRYGGSFAIWGAAEIQFTSSSIPFLATAGITANATIFLRINTDSASQTINFLAPTPGGSGTTPETFTLQPFSFGLYLVGSLTLQKGPIDFVLGGVFDVDFVYNSTTNQFSFNVFVFAELTLGIGGQNIFTFNALGLLQINNNGFGAMLAVSTDLNSPVLTFNFNFTLFVNTTGQQVSYTLPSDLTGIMAQDSGAIDTSGSLFTGLENELTALSTEFGTLVTTGTDPDSGNPTLTIIIPGGLPQISDVAGSVHYNGPGPLGPYLLIEGAGQITLLPGALGSDAPSIQGTAEFEASGQGVSLYIEGSLTIGPLVIAASGDIQVLQIASGPSAGDWGLVAAISLNATLNLGGGTSLGGAATLEINTTQADQTVKEFTYDLSSNKISNTPVDTTIPGSVLLRVNVEGQLTFANAIALKGAFELTVGHDATYGTYISMAATASLSFFGLNLNIGATLAAAIYAGTSPGTSGLLFYININCDLSIASVIELDGSVTLSVDTFSSGGPTSVPLPGGGSQAMTPGFSFSFLFSVNVLDGLLTAAVKGSITYNNNLHILTMAFELNGGVSLFGFTLGNLSLGGWMDSTGEFAIGVGAYFSFGIPDIATVSGGGWLVVAYTANGNLQLDSNDIPIAPTDPSFSGTPNYSGTHSVTVEGGASLTGSLFGFDIGTVGVTFNYHNGSLSVHISISLNFFFFSITISFTLTIGSTNEPPPVYLAGTPTTPQIDPGAFGGGALVLNVGNRAGNRGYDNTDHNEGIVVDGANYNLSNKTETIYVTYIPSDGTAPYTQVFKGVTSVTIPGTGSNNIEVDNDVAIPIYATAGANGAASIIDAGTGGGSLTGGPDDDLIESGGTESGNSTTINGGGGHDTIIVGAGPVSINTASGSGSRVLWNTDTAGTLNWTGTAGDILYASANDPSDLTHAHGETLSLSSPSANIARLTGGSGNTASITNVPTIILSAPGGGNTINIGNMVGGGVTSLQISYGATHSLANQISIAGSSGADTYTISSGTALLPSIPTVTVSAPNSSGYTAPPVVSLSVSTLSVPTVNVNRTGGLQIEVFGDSNSAGDTLALNSKGGNDTIYVDSVSLPTTVQGNDASASNSKPYTTTYYIGWQGSSTSGSLATVTALLTVVGTNGTDVLNMMDQNDLFNRTFNLTNTQMFSDALGNNGRLVYNALVDSFNLFAGPGENNYVISGTGAVGQTRIISGDTNLTVTSPPTSPASFDGGANLGQHLNGDPLVVGNVLTIDDNIGGYNFIIFPGEIDGYGSPIFFTNFQTLIIEGKTGNDTFTINGNSINLLIDDPLYNGNSTYSAPSYTQVPGSASFTVIGNSGTIALFGGTGTNSFAIAGNAGTIDINDPARVGADQGQGSATYTINGNSASMSINGLAGSNSYTVNANTGALSLTGGSGLGASNSFSILSNFGSIAITSEGGSNNYSVTGISAPVTLNTSDYFPASYVITAPLQASVSITGFAGRPSLATIISELNTDTITEDLLGAFKGYGITLSSTATLATNSATSWTITDSSAAYAIIEDANGLLTITKATAATLPFTDPNIGGADAGALNSNTISANLSALFTSHSITLTSPAVTANSSISWTITSGANSYLVLENPSGLLTISRTGTAGLPFTDANAGGADSTALNSGGVPANLNTLFNSHSITLSSPTVTINSSTSWAIVSGTNTYNVTKQSSGVLTIADSTTAGLPFSYADTGNADATTLNSRTITTRLSDAFAADGVSLSTPTIVAEVPGSEWLLIQGSSYYLLTESAGQLTMTPYTAVMDSAATSFVPPTQTLTVNGTSANENFTLTSTSVSGVGSTVHYTGLLAVTMNGNGGNDTFTVSGNVAASKIITGLGTAFITVSNLSAPLSINSQLGVNTISFGNLLSNLAGAITITGSGQDTLTLDDTSNAAGINGTLSRTTFSIASSTFGGLTYSGLAALNINLGSGADTLVISSTASSTPVAIDTGTGINTINIQSISSAVTIASDGTDTINLGSLAPALTGGNLTLIQGALAITGTGHTTLNLDNDTDANARTATLSATKLTGLGLVTAGITYVGLSNFNLSLGTGGNNLTITSTAANVSYQITGGTGGDTFNIQSTNAAGPVTIGTGTGSNTVNVGSLAPATGGTLSNVLGQISLTGTGTDTLNLDDTGSSANRTINITAVQINITGVAAVLYTTIDTLNIAPGSGTITATVTSTASGTNTTLSTGNGNNTVTINSTSTASTGIQTGTGNDTIQVNAISGPTSINVGTGTNSVTIGNNGVLDAITASLNIRGSGTDTITINAGSSAAANTSTLNAGSYAITSPAGIGAITFSNDTALANLNLNYNSLGTTLLIAGTPATATTTITAGDGVDHVTITGTSGKTLLYTGISNDTFSVQGIGGQTTIYTGGNPPLSTGVNTVTVSSTSNKLTGIQGLLTIDGTGGDTTVTFDDSGDTSANSGTLISSGLTGLGLGTAGAAYTNITTLNVMLGSGGANLTVSSTDSATTDINGTSGNDSITVASDSGTTNINAGTGYTATNIQATASGSTTTVTTATGGHNAITISQGGEVDDIHGLINLLGNGLDIVVVDDSVSSNAKSTPMLTTLALENLSAANIDYGNLTSLTINLGVAPDTFTIANTSVPTTLNLGNANDVVVLENDSNSTVINTADPANTIDIQQTTAPTIIVSPVGSTDTINVGKNGSLAAILFPLSITGNGTDIVNIDDSADSTGRTVTLTASALTGVAPAEIDYANLATLNILFGPGSNNLTVTNTASSITNLNFAGGSDTVTVQNDSGPTNINTGAGSNTVSIQATTGTTTITTPAGGTTTTTLGNNHNVDTITTPLTITGGGSDSLIVDDASNPNTKFVNLTSSVLSGVTPKPITYSGLASLTVDLGPAGNFLVVGSTSGSTSTTFNTGAGDDFVTIGATTGPLSVNTQAGDNTEDIGGLLSSTLADITGPVTINGDGFDVLTLDESYQTTADTGIVTPTTITGFSPATITYGGIQTLLMTLGSSTNAINVTGTSSSSTVSSGKGTDSVTVSSTAPNAGGTLDNVNGDLSILGNGSDTLTLDDSGSTANKTIDLSSMTETGGSPASISYKDLASLKLLTGTGADTVNVTDNGTLDLITTPMDVQGGGNTTLNLNDTASTEAKSSTLTSTDVTGLAPADISYSNLVGLNISLGSGTQTVAIHSTAAGTSTTITAGSGNDTFNLSGTGSASLASGLAGPLTLDGATGANTLNVDDSTDSASSNVTLTANSITGMGAGITYLNFISLNTLLGTSSSLTVNGSNPGTTTSITGSSTGTPVSLNYPGDFTGTLALTDVAGGTISIGGSLSGNLSIDGSLDTISIGQNLTGSLSITGNLGSMSIAGSDSGSITVGSVGTISVAHATASGSNGTVFSLTQGGTFRSINTSGASATLTANVFYEGANPEAAIELDNDPSSFDLMLTSAGSSSFNLERIDSVGGTQTGLFNLAINGSLLASIDAVTSNYFSYAAGTQAGVDLPLDHLGLISVSLNLPSNSILASSIQGIAFATLTLPNGTTQSAGYFRSQTTLLGNVLVINLKTKKPYAQVVAPGSQPLLVMLSPGSTVPVGVFTGKAKKGTKFAATGLAFTDQNSDPAATLMALVSFVAGKKTVNNISFQGDGGSIDTGAVVNNISSDGWLGDVLLEGGHKLLSLTAASIHGNVNLFGGQLVGELQTTDGDLGTSDAVAGTSTVLHVAMGKTASIVVRGNLLSKVNIDKNMSGTIAASGDIGAISMQNRAGGISIGGSDTGQIIAIGNILGDIVINGNLGGRIAAKGASITGFGANQKGILGRINIGGQMLKTSAVVSDGEIGDSALGTKLAMKADQGLIASGGLAVVSSGSTGKTAATIASAADQPALVNIWTNGGAPLEIDSAPGALDQAGLKLIQSDLTSLKAANGKLSGTTA